MPSLKAQSEWHVDLRRGRSVLDLTGDKRGWACEGLEGDGMRVKVMG